MEALVASRIIDELSSSVADLFHLIFKATGNAAVKVLHTRVKHKANHAVLYNSLLVLNLTLFDTLGDNEDELAKKAIIR